jgi:hypothetical protein
MRPGIAKRITKENRAYCALLPLLNSQSVVVVVVVVK